MRANPATRRGYTLLEVLLASMIAVVLLGALYAALEVTLVRMDVNRNVIVANDLSRAVFNRVTIDLSNTLGPLPPKSGGDGTTGSAAASTSTTTTATSASSGATAASSPSADPSGTAAAADPTSSAASTGVNIPFGAGVVGSDKQVTLFVSRLPTALTDLDVINATDVALPSDLRRVTYYLATDGGLARQSKPWVTADGVWNATDPDRSNEAAEVIAPEVLDATFEYYDGGTWLSQWDGSATAIDGTSLTGPPRAIRVTLVLEFSARGGRQQKRVTQVIPLRAAVGNYQPADATTTTPTTTTSTTGGM